MLLAVGGANDAEGAGDRGMTDGRADDVDAVEVDDEVAAVVEWATSSALSMVGELRA